jgi:FHA domain
MASLEVLSPERRDFLELEGERVTIGRDDRSDLVIKEDSSLSRQHAVLEKVGTVWYINDLDSLNGTEVNGKPVAGGRRALHNNDEILLGRTKFVFRDHVPYPDSSTAPKMPCPKLTAKEQETLLELCRPLFANTSTPFRAPASVLEIGERMYVGRAAVQAHLSRLFDKFGIYEEGRDRKLELANQAIQRGCVGRKDYRSDDTHDA